MAGKILMPDQIMKCRWLLGGLVLGVTMLAAQSQPQPQPPSAQQQALEAFADKLIAAPDEEARNALLSANRDLVTADLVHLINTRGTNLLRAKTDLPQTRAIFDIALKVAEPINDKSGTAASLTDISLVLKDQGDYEASLDYSRKAIAIYEELKDPALARAYNNAGIVLRLRGNFREAADYYTRALKIYEAQGSKKDIAMASFNLGNAYASLGNQRLALEQYKRSMEISQEQGLQLGLAYNINSLGNLYDAQGDYDLALSYYEQSLKLKEKAANQREIADTLMNIGVVYQEMGKTAPAREYLEKALKLKEALGDKNGVAMTLFNYGFMLREQGDYAGALEREQASISACKAIGNQFLLSEALTEMARDYYAQKDYSRALESGDRASEIARQIGDQSLSRALDITALALAGLDRAEEARSTLAQAISAVEELRGQIAGDEQEQADFLAKKIEPYQHMVQLLVSEDKLAQAFEFAERTKARALLDVMRSGRIRVDKAMTAQEKEQEQQFINQLASLNAKLSVEKSKPTADSARQAQLSADLEKVRLDYRGFQTTLYAAHPELQVERGDAQPASLDQTAALLPDAKTALLEFVVTEDKTYLFALVKGTAASTPQLTAYTLPVREKELRNDVEHFREQLATRDPDYGKPARALYRLLLRPAHAALAGKTAIVIVPDGALWELPFQALQPREDHHLLEDAAVSYAPSLTVLLEMARRHRDNRIEAPRLLALGNPVFSQQDAARLVAQMDAAPNGHALRDLPVDLPNARHEVAALPRLYGVKNSAIYTGAAATEQTFKAKAGNYDVLHLATHGVFDNRSPMYSYLMLSEKADDADEDGLLEAWEVINLNLKADLVVLSACETARGKASSGEGVIGMSWAFFVAGSPSLVASQWKVDSASTTQLMLHFHRRLQSLAGIHGDSPKARALQQAALSVMKKPEYRHPFYWAGFVLIGNGS